MHFISISMVGKPLHTVWDSSVCGMWQSSRLRWEGNINIHHLH